MASRTPSRRRAGGRSSSSQNSNQMPMILGGLGVMVLIVILVMANRGGDDEEVNPDNQSTKQPGKQPAKQPEPKTNLKMSERVAGKTPDRPAPTLTQATLTKITELLAEAKAMSDEGIRMRKGGDNKGCRAKQSEAKVKIDQIKSMIETQSLWQEEADMGDWAQPAEYITLARIYIKIGTTEKTIRMQGGR